MLDSMHDVSAAHTTACPHHSEPANIPGGHLHQCEDRVVIVGVIRARGCAHVLDHLVKRDLRAAGGCQVRCRGHPDLSRCTTAVHKHDTDRLVVLLVEVGRALQEAEGDGGLAKRRRHLHCEWAGLLALAVLEDNEFLEGRPVVSETASDLVERLSRITGLPVK